MTELSSTRIIDKAWPPGVYVYQKNFLKKKGMLSRYPERREAFIKDLEKVPRNEEDPKKDYVSVLENYKLLGSKEADHLREHWFTKGEKSKWFPAQTGQGAQNLVGGGLA